MSERIVAGLLSAVLWLGVWLSPMLLTMAMACLLVWGWQGEDYLVSHIAMVLALAAGLGLLPACWLSERVRQPAPIPSSPLNAVTPASRRRHRSSVWLSRYLATGLIRCASRAYQAASTAFL